jgi:hypothetical protein
MRAPEGASAILVSVDRSVKHPDRRRPSDVWEPEPLLLPLDVPDRRRRDRSRPDDDAADEREPGTPGSVVIVIDLA